MWLGRREGGRLRSGRFAAAAAKRPERDGAARTAPPLVIVVVQLVLTLRMRALRALALVTALRSPHRHVARAGRMGRRKRELALQRCALALWAGRRLLTSDEGLEVVAAVLAGVFVDRYDDTPGLEFVSSWS